jgi:hypothetical protein
MMLEHLTLAQQLALVFKTLQEELSQLSSGTVFVQIRNNIIGKFGIRHLPFEGRNGKVESKPAGLSTVQQQSLLKMAIESLKYKTNWTHGEIMFDFSVRHNTLRASVQFESNYNMAALFNSRK